MIRSAIARMGASCLRSLAMLLLMERSVPQRMRAAGLAEAAQQGGVVGLQKDQLGVQRCA